MPSPRGRAFLASQPKSSPRPLGTTPPVHPLFYGLTVQLFSNVFCYLLRNALALDLSEAQRTKGIHSLGAPVCVPGNHQWWAPGLVRPRLQGRLLAGTPGSRPRLQGCGSTHSSLARPVQGPGFCFTLVAVVSQT